MVIYYFSLASFPDLFRFCACLVRPASSLSCESLGSPYSLDLPLSLVGLRARGKQTRDRKLLCPLVTFNAVGCTIAKR